LPEKTSNWFKLRRIKRSQWAVILQSPWVLLSTSIRLHRNGYQKTLDHVNRLHAPVVPAELQAGIARETAFALAVAVRFGPWRPLCLTRSLALAWFLKRRGIPCVLRIGVPRGTPMTKPGEPVTFSAHAWVEHEGIVLNDRQDIAGQFSAFDTGTGPA